MIVLKNVLVPTDVGEPAAAALAYGRELARSWVVRLAPCPVLTVHDHERHFVAPESLVTAGRTPMMRA